MEPIAALTTPPKSSLIVELRYQPLCAQCTKMLPLWCESPAYQRWTWTHVKLIQSSSTCRCCRFLVQVLEASPWIQMGRDEQVSVVTYSIGSQHRAENSNRSTFKSYYRPLLFVGKPVRSALHSFILPVPQIHDGSSDECEPEMFCGRPVNARIDLSLVASWHKICTSRHEDSADDHSCCPQTHEPVKGFRVIDVQQRCVVRVNGKVDYAALSYVWGNAKRLVLSKSNETWLTRPGALSQTEEDVPKTFRDALEVATALGIVNLWVDALCIDQTDPEQVKHHMEAMDKIYGSAVLTIVATAESVDVGLPGISLLRGPPQAVFQYNGVRYLSSKSTFGAAIQNSPWEKRAWCLQEKLFSTRLLIFTDAQVFYHCVEATWFEDTTMEMTKSNHKTLHLRENPVSRKQGRHKKMMDSIIDSQGYTAYDSQYTAFKKERFWSLVSSYSKREMSFEADVIRAFGGVLRSVEAQHGRAIWGIPQYHFLRGLSWHHDVHRMNLRREGFPSWSWVGWRCSDNHLRFANCKRKDIDIGFMDGRYRVTHKKHNGHSVWTLTWFYYTTEEDDDQLQLKTVQLEPQDCSTDPQSAYPTSSAASLEKPETSIETNIEYSCFSEWDLPGHPRSVEATHQPVLPLMSKLKMPPITHILRFYTSVATVLVHHNPTLNIVNQKEYRLLIPGTSFELARVNIDSLWSGIGNLHSLVYISRYCPEYYAYQKQDDKTSEGLHLLLVESVPGWGEVKSRVQLVQSVDILDWRKANPKWELVSLA